MLRETQVTKIGNVLCVKAHPFEIVKQDDNSWQVTFSPGVWELASLRILDFLKQFKKKSGHLFKIVKYGN